MIIGIAGLAGSGKDTVCDILRHYSVIDSRYAFADPLKKAVNALFGWGEKHAFGDQKEVDQIISISDLNHNAVEFIGELHMLSITMFGVSANAIFEYFKSELASYINTEIDCYVISPRQAYQIFGTEVCRDRIDAGIWTKLSPTHRVCIPDVRFLNEADWVNQNNGKIIRIIRPDVGSVAEHESESYIDAIDADIEIINDSSLYALEKAVLRVIEFLNLDYDKSIQPLYLLDSNETQEKYVEKQDYKRLALLDETIDTMGDHGNWNYDQYTHGVLNGLLMAQGIISGSDYYEQRGKPSEYVRSDTDKDGFTLLSELTHGLQNNVVTEL